jgi:hypothetical protein
MGRGRAKAKQTKVARELKYSTHGTDLAALQAELAGQRPRHSFADDVDTGVEAGDESGDDLVDEDEYDDPYAAYLDETDDDATDDVDEERQAR